MAEQLPISVLRQVIQDVQTKTIVDWSPKRGAVCPICGQVRCRVSSTLSWCGTVRERYHRCQRCGHTFKSLEDES